LKRLEDKKKALERQVKERTEAAEALQNALSEVEQLKNRLHAENIYLQTEISHEHNFTDFISRSPALQKILAKVEQVAATDATVLILGESGTGKELLARAIHNLSQRSDHPLVKVNCAALPMHLIESELFGHEKGAFTGAIARKAGRFELADGGTIFLDEIGEMPLELQAKLLRILQDGEFERVGGQQTLKVDTRVIAATNRDLKTEIQHGRFREDLYYRLYVFPITIPPLRERKEDIPLLVNHFVKKYSAKTGKKIESVSQHIIDTLQAYPWPGNVRELENVIERAVIVSPGKQLKLDDWLPSSEGESVEEPTALGLEEMERNHILKVLKQTGWRISGEKGAARILNINASTLRSRMEKLGIMR
jgi:transcriptional regulator with GAF, ATPase, and Fis domain